MKDNRIFGRKRYHIAFFTLVLLFVVAMVVMFFSVSSHAQTQQKKIAVWFETPGSQVSSNGLQQALQVELGEGVEVLAYTTQQDDFHAVLRLMRADLSRLTPRNPSAWRQGAASTAMIFVQVIGQRASSTMSRGGVAGAAVGAGVSTATNQASQGAYRNIVYKRHMEADVPLYYAFCKGKSLRLECTKEAAIWYRIRQDNDPQGGQSLWTLKGFGRDKDQIQNFPKDKAVYLYEGAGGFYRQDLLQELLFRFLLEEAGSGKPNLIGASQLAIFLQDVQAAASARFRPVSAAPTPVPTAVVDAEEQHRRDVAAKLNSGGMVPMHKPQVLQQARRCNRDELVQDGGGN